MSRILFVANLAPLGPVLLSLAVLGWCWRLARAKRPTTARPPGEELPSLALRQLAAIPAAPRETPRAAPGAPDASVHDAPTAPISGASTTALSAEAECDVTVIDSLATMRARLQMTV